MNDETFDDLSGKTLISTPYMIREGIFHKSLIYMISHTPNGAIGLIFNHLVNRIDLKSLFKVPDDKLSDSLMVPIYLGGPVEHERGFFLHSTDYDKNMLLQFNEDLAVSSNSEISNDIITGHGPKNSIFIIGYTAWRAGELEHELKNNLWIITDCDKEFIFADHPESKWDAALKKAGVSQSRFASYIGSA